MPHNSYSSNEMVVLVDENDRVTGLMEKLRAHQLGLLHRAISVFIFNSKGELLLQRRAARKYHSAGLWSNTCCSHPREGETVYAAAKRRLFQEMRLECELSHKFSFTYKAVFANGLTEYEFDHVFVGVSDAIPDPAKEEVSEWKYMTPDALVADVIKAPDLFSDWFRICIDQHFSKIFI